MRGEGVLVHALFMSARVFSLHQNFPFSVMSINMTRIALQVLREEALSK